MVFADLIKRDFTALVVIRVLVGDILSLRITHGSNMYLASVIDWYCWVLVGFAVARQPKHYRCRRRYASAQLRCIFIVELLRRIPINPIPRTHSLTPSRIYSHTGSRLNSDALGSVRRIEAAAIKQETTEHRAHSVMLA